ncbi:hypothetical protein BJV82DRAFT_663239 [Fennellomyces sp. T-0311]|nr:hypothetical protein BJV82DRAFT_663239 [Fennellomyces sp. T-0311]
MNTNMVTLVFLLLTLCFIVKGEYNISSEIARHLTPLYGCATIVVNDTLYCFGGDKTQSNSYGNMTVIQIDHITGDLTAQQRGIPEEYRSVNGRAVLLDDHDTVLVIGGETYPNLQAPFINRYQFSTGNWSTVAVNASESIIISQLDLERTIMSANLGLNNTIYIYGGIKRNITAASDPLMISNELLSYNADTNVLTNYTTSQGLPFLQDHSSITLPDGRIVYLMGQEGHSTYDVGFENYSYCDHVYVLDPRDMTFNRIEVTAAETDIPLQRAGASSTLGPDGTTIYVFGGWGVSEVLLNAPGTFNDLWALDTTTWTWNKISANMNIPRSRTKAASGLLYNRYFMVAFGLSDLTYLQDIHLFDIESSAWIIDITLPPETVEQKDHYLGSFLQKHPKAIYFASAIILAIVIVIIVILMITFGSLRKTVRSIFWDRRVGEAAWTEAFRLVVKAFMAVYMYGYLVYVIEQARTSPNVMNTSINSEDTVGLPDMRFCFEGWAIEGLQVGCQTDILSTQDCIATNYIHRLDMSLHVPYFGSGLGEIQCFLFAPPPGAFVLGYQDKSQNEQVRGKMVEFLFYGFPDLYDGTIFPASGSVQVVVYPPGNNPNIQAYNLAGQPGIMEQEISPENMQNWRISETVDTPDNSKFYVETGAASSIRYQLHKTTRLLNSTWNYFGIFQDKVETTTIDAIYEAGIPNNVYLQQYAASALSVYPDGFVTVKDEESRVHTLYSSLSLAAALFPTFTQIIEMLFGVRGGSPWGKVQQWGTAIPQVRRSIEKYLKKDFGDYIGTRVPFVNAVQGDPTNHEKERHGLQPLFDSQKSEVLNNSLSETPSDLSASTAKAKTRIEEKDLDTIDAPLTTNELYRSHIALQKEVKRLEQSLQFMEIVYKAYYMDNEIFVALHELFYREEIEQKAEDNANLQEKFSQFKQRLSPSARRSMPQDHNDPIVRDLQLSNLEANTVPPLPHTPGDSSDDRSIATIPTSPAEVVDEGIHYSEQEGRVSRQGRDRAGAYRSVPTNDGSQTS